MKEIEKSYELFFSCCFISFAVTEPVFFFDWNNKCVVHVSEYHSDRGGIWATWLFLGTTPGTVLSLVALRQSHAVLEIHLYSAVSKANYFTSALFHWPMCLFFMTSHVSNNFFYSILFLWSLCDLQFFVLK